MHARRPMLRKSPMFRGITPVTVWPTAKARQTWGLQLRPAGLTAWRELTRRSQVWGHAIERAG